MRRRRWPSRSRQSVSEISFDANTGDAAARKALDKANAATTTVSLEIENLRSAIEEAKRRLAEAERAEEHAALAANGDKARVIGDSLLERSEKIDRAFVYIRAELEGFKTDLDELHSLGLANPRAEQFKVLGGLALSTALMGLPLKSERDHLAPKERRSFTDLAAGWRTSIHRWADGLGKAEAA